jgi:DNA ligase-associated metallophosphoesterase
MEIRQGEQLVEIAGQNFILSPHKAAFWIEESILLVADVHLGKETHFRKGGLAVPGHVLYSNLEKLDHLVNDFPVKRVIFLGDLFHSRYNDAWQPFSAWMHGWPEVSFELVLGNHDILDKRLYAGANMKVHKEPYEWQGIYLSHHPMEVGIEGYNFYGHIHPGVALEGPAKQYLKLPCFLLGEQAGILPAFGQFTGLAMVKPTSQDRVFVIGDEKVIALS